MPYVTQPTRNLLDDKINELVDALLEMDPKSVDGALNYTITSLMTRVYAQPYNYYNLNRANGVINSVRDEWYRRVVAPYEDQKAYENGDVYPSQQ